MVMEQLTSPISTVWRQSMAPSVVGKAEVIPLRRSTITAIRERGARPLALLAVFLVAGAIGVYTLNGSHAATVTANIEAESGTASACASRASDSTASNSLAVKFSACGSLSETGATIPDTNYAIPSGAIFMATNGNDSNAGTQAAPVLTLAKAYSLVPSGGTIVVRAGLYRDGSTSSLTKTFTIQPYPHEQVWFDGTDVTTGWTSDGAGHWYVAWSTPQFCGGHYYDLPYNQQSSSNTGPCTHYDMYGDPANPAAGDPQMVFEDGTYIHEVTSLAAASGQNFFYDQTAQRLYLGFDPTSHTVELASRPNALVLQGGSGGNIVRGLGFTRFATQEYGSYSTDAAVLVNVPNTTIENDVFTHMAAAGLAFANPTGGVINSDVFANNGFDGAVGNGHEHSTGATDGLIIENSIFNGNDTERYGTGCSASCAAAGMKIAHMDGFTLQNNLFENGVSPAHGFWCDEACTNGIMVGNVFHDNAGHGLFYEVSDTGIIASNLAYNNGAEGIKMGSADTKVYNNTLVNNGVGALIYDDSRDANNLQGTQIGPDTTNVDFDNNIIYGSGTMVQAWRTSTSNPPDTGPATFFDDLNYNSYYRANGSQVLYSWKELSGGSLVTTNYTALSSLTAKGWESQGRDISNGTNPFTNLSGGDYTVVSTSPDYHSGKSLPADVAAALGLSTSTTVSRGAIKWYPNGN